MPGPAERAAYAVLAVRDQGPWDVELLPDALIDELDALIAAVRLHPGENGALALVDVADEFFVALRIAGGQVQLLLSDVTAALDWDLAADVLDHLDLPLPAEHDQDVRPAGDLSIFADLGLDERELAALLSDLDAYADELLSSLARRLGFGDAYERVVDALMQ